MSELFDPFKCDAVVRSTTKRPNMFTFCKTHNRDWDECLIAAIHERDEVIATTNSMAIRAASDVKDALAATEKRAEEAERKLSNLNTKAAVLLYYSIDDLVDSYSTHLQVCAKAKEQYAEIVSKLAAANQRADDEHVRLMRMIADTVDGMECLPECDSYGHEEVCPVTNPVQAWRLLRKQLATVKEENERLKRGEFAWMIERRADVENESSMPLWWDGSTKFTPDPNGGTRFARKQDAERIIETHGLIHARATDHIWFATTPSPEGEAQG